MEGDGIPLKEDSSFEILQLLDDDEIPLEKTHNPKDEIEYVVTEKEDDVSSNNICKWTNDSTNRITEIDRIASNNFSSVTAKSSFDSVTIYSMDIKEIGNVGRYFPICSSDQDKMMTSYGFKSSEAINKPKEKTETKADQPYEILVISTGEFNCRQTEEQYVPTEFLKHVNNEFTEGEYSSCVSRTGQRNEIQSGIIVSEEVVKNDKTHEFLRRATCDRKICEFVDNGIQFCSWLRSRKCIDKFVKKAKASFKSIASTVELEINQILGSENPLRLSIISDGISAQAIEEAFSEVFRGHVLASVINVDLDTMPPLPIGNLAGLQAAEMKIDYARQCKLAYENSVAISTSILLHEAVSHRWQMMTVISLDDPNLPLNLHNFTATTPIPNQYVVEAERQTLPNYLLRDYGLAVDIKQAIGAVTKMTSEDAQEFLTGVSYYSTLKSAALVLAGIYKKYTIK